MASLAGCAMDTTKYVEHHQQLSRPRGWSTKDAALRPLPSWIAEAQKKVQCTRAIKTTEALLPGAEPKIDFEYGMVYCKVAGKHILVAEITHDSEKFTWRMDDIRTDGTGSGSQSGAYRQYFGVA